MTVNFAANPGLLKYVHRLQKPWRAHSNLLGKCTKFFGMAERAELGVQVVHRMAKLVEAQMCLVAQCAGGVERIFFEEAANLVATL